MPAFLHLLKADSAASLATSVIESNLAEPDARVTVVLLDGASAPSLPAGVTVRRLADALKGPGCARERDSVARVGDQLQVRDLIFAHDHVITW